MPEPHLTILWGSPVDWPGQRPAQNPSPLLSSLSNTSSVLSASVKHTQKLPLAWKNKKGTEISSDDLSSEPAILLAHLLLP